MQTLPLGRIQADFYATTARSYSHFHTMADQVHQRNIPQNTTNGYLTRDSLQNLLKGLFSPQTDFNIRVRRGHSGFAFTWCMRG